MRSVLAQVVAEARMRLRSTSTIFAVLGVFALSFLYLPDPSANRVSISWRDGGGALISGVYSSSYVGAVIGMLSALFLTLIGFYLVAGSIRRDRERHVLEIIAATPVSRLEFILGKWMAHSAYLLIVASTSLVAGVILFLRYGEGSLHPLQFLYPWLLMVPGAMTFTAALAVLFDVTPVLRSRFGWVAWFFAWIFLFMALPTQMAGRLESDQAPHPTIYDPAGLMAFHEMIEEAVPVGGVEELSMGIMVISEPVTRVPIRRMSSKALFRPRRAWTLVWITTVLLLSAALFRFKTSPGREPRTRRIERDEPSFADGGGTIGWIPTGERRRSTLGAVLAESRLIWNAAGWIRWPFVITSALTLFLPLASAQGVAAIAILLVGPIISEVAAREAIHGTATLVLPSPSVPGSHVLWKLGAIGLFVVVGLSPLLTRAILHGPRYGVVFLTGMAGTVLLSTGLGRLTRGGKFFTGLYVVSWYIATQGVPSLDFTGWFAAEPSIEPAAIWLAAGLATVAPAALLEKRLGEP